MLGQPTLQSPNTQLLELVQQSLEVLGHFLCHLSHNGKEVYQQAFVVASEQCYSRNWTTPGNQLHLPHRQGQTLSSNIPKSRKRPLQQHGLARSICQLQSGGNTPWSTTSVPTALTDYTHTCLEMQYTPIGVKDKAKHYHVPGQIVISFVSSLWKVWVFPY